MRRALLCAVAGIGLTASIAGCGGTTTVTVVITATPARAVAVATAKATPAVRSTVQLTSALPPIASLPSGFAAAGDTYTSDATIAVQSKTPLQDFISNGRILGLERTYRRAALSGLVEATIDVVAFRTPAGAHWDYLRVKRNFDGDSSEHGISLSPVGDETASYTASRTTSTGINATDISVDFRRNGYQCVVDAVGYANTFDPNEVLSIAQAEDNVLRQAPDASRVIGTSPGGASTPVPAAPAANPQGILTGNSPPALPPGKPGALAVVATGTYGGALDGTLAIVIRNNGGEPVHSVSATAEARAASGKLIATGDTQDMYPYVVYPGQIAIGHLSFSGSPSLPTDVHYTISASAQSGATQDFGAKLDLKVTESNLTGTSIVGIVANQTGKTATGPFSVEALCFSSSGTLTRAVSGFAQGEVTAKLPAGGTAPFTLDLNNTACPRYLIGASGFSF